MRSMTAHDLPTELQQALHAGVWKDPGPDALARMLQLEGKTTRLGLFPTRDVMENVARDLDVNGYVDDPEFCMVRDTASRRGPDDLRLTYATAWFIGGAKQPGDDEFLAIDLNRPGDSSPVVWFDWSRTVPARWVRVCGLDELLDALSRSRR